MAPDLFELGDFELSSHAQLLLGSRAALLAIAALPVAARGRLRGGGVRVCPALRVFVVAGAVFADHRARDLLGRGKALVDALDVCEGSRLGRMVWQMQPQMNDFTDRFGSLHGSEGGVDTRPRRVVFVLDGLVDEQVLELVWSGYILNDHL